MQKVEGVKVHDLYVILCILNLPKIFSWQVEVFSENIKRIRITVSSIFILPFVYSLHYIKCNYKFDLWIVSFKQIWPGYVKLDYFVTSQKRMINYVGRYGMTVASHPILIYPLPSSRLDSISCSNYAFSFGVELHASLPIPL